MPCGRMIMIGIQCRWERDGDQQRSIDSVATCFAQVAQTATSALVMSGSGRGIQEAREGGDICEA